MKTNGRIVEIYPTTMFLLVTEGCNLRCKYCYQQNNQYHNNLMTERTAKKSLDMLFDNATKFKEKQVDITLFGGEPLCNPHLIEYIFDYGLTKQKQTKINFSASIITNGTVMNDYIEWLFMEYKHKVDLHCQLSIDGIKEVHDTNRVTIDGKGSFDMIEKNVKTFKKIFQKEPDRLAIHGCITKDSLPLLYDSYSFFRKEWDMRNIWFMPVHEESWTSSDVRMYDIQMGKIFDYIKHNITKENYRDLRIFTPLNKCLKPLKQFDAPCGAGKTLVTVTANGDIYPCHNFYTNDPKHETKIGSVYEGIDFIKNQELATYTYKDMSCPSSCDNYNCYRCIATNWVYNGDFKKQIRGSYCSMSKVEQKYTEKMRRLIADLGIETKKEKEPMNEIQYVVSQFAINATTTLKEIQTVKKELAEIKTMLNNRGDV